MTNIRPIDGNELLEQMKHRKDYVGRLSDPICLVQDAPTIDTMPMVRCKDCKYSCACYSDGGEDLYDCCKDVIFGNADTTTLRTSDWFCADGKRYDE